MSTKSGRTFHARVGLGSRKKGQRFHLGNWKNEVAAAKAWDQAAICIGVCDCKAARQRYGHRTILELAAEFVPLELGFTFSEAYVRLVVGAFDGTLQLVKEPPSDLMSAPRTLTSPFQHMGAIES